VQWEAPGEARTRRRISELQPPRVESVTIQVDAGETCAQLCLRLVVKPHGVVCDDPQLKWDTIQLFPGTKSTRVLVRHNQP
jgi:hypothetical protein